MKKINIELTNKNGIHIDDETIFEDIIEKVFYFDKTFYSFKNNKNVLYFKKSGDQKNIWVSSNYDKNKDCIIEGKKTKMLPLNIFDKYFKNIFIDDKIPITFDEIFNNYKNVLLNNYKNNSLLFINILFHSLILNKEIIIINKKKLSRDTINIINELNSFVTLEEQLSYIKKQVKKQYSEKLLKEFFLKIYGIEDIKIFNKIHSFFNKRINLPGKYLIRHNEILFESLF